MNKETWAPILVGTVILGTIGYLALKVSDIDGTLRSVDTKVGNTEKRVDRIADALPEMRIRIAMEEVQRPIQSAIITTTPFQDAKGQWKVNMHLLDAAKSEQTTYSVSLTDQSDRRPIYLLVGASADAEPSAPTVRDLSIWSSEIKNPKSVPAFIDAKGSVVFRQTNASDIKKRLYKLGTEVQRQQLDSKVSDWNQLADTLKANPSKFEPVP